ncbi:MAG: TonB-dependent receptor, partial [Myxococcota bacterium]
MAQVNTTSVRGKVLGTDSAPVAAAKVTLTHEPSGVKLSRVTDKGGAFSFSTRRVGGPYRVEVEAGGYDTRVIRDLFLRLGRTKTLQVKMDLVEVERLVVQGRSVTKRVSSAKKYGREDVQRLPSVSRDPKDIVRLTPEAVVDGDDDQLSIGGVNSRFNSVTIDGIRQDDDFGLNNSGYPTRRSPISIAAIEEIAVEISPFDVEYQGFLGGNVNIVTKSGTNEFQGSLFTNYTSDTFTGSRSRADAFELDFEEFTYGATFSGPIIEDKLHFFVGVDGLLATSPNEVGPAGSGAPNQISEVTEADVARAQQISRDVYGFDAGTAGQSLDEDDLKLIAKIDWAIDDSHHLVANFQQTIGSTIEPRGSFFNNLGLTSNWYEKQDNLTTASAKLRSDWTYDLSTEVELSTKFVDTIQRPLTGRDFMQAEIGTPGGGFLRLGPDEFRHANRLENNLFFAKGRAEYLWRDHLFSAGVEYERLDVFNLFVPGSRGVAEYDTLDAFAAQTPTALLYNNSVTNNARDAAAEWWFSRISTYVQDELELTPELSVQAGLRFETFQASRDIDFNQNFQNRHGFSNTETLNGRGVMLPRAAITYAPVEWINVRGGFGLFSGGTPNVWVSNTYGNTGISIDETFETDPAILA